MNHKRLLLRRGILASAALLAGGATISLAVTPAGASNTQMSIVGSSTTFLVMHALFPEVNDINPFPVAGSNTQSIAADPQTCVGGVTYSTSNQAPNGSGAGKKALAAEESAAANEQGCIDFGRSSSPPAPSTETLPSGGTESGDPSGSHLDYYAYALSAVAPLVGSDAPANATETNANNGLTLNQVKQIYECVLTNWDQVVVNGVHGANEPISLFWPQPGSGTTAVATDVLGFDPEKPGVGPDQCTTAAPNSFSAGGNSAPNEENTEDGIIYANSLVTGCAVAAPGPSCPAAEAIYLYGAGNMTGEWNNTAAFNSTANNQVKQNLDGSATADNSLGNFLAGTLTLATMQSKSGIGEAYVDLTPQVGPFDQDHNRGTLAQDANTINEANEWYTHLPSGDTGNPSISLATVPGVRFVYNEADTVLPGYNGAKMTMGFDNQAGGTKSTLCNGDDSATIAQQGFLPLTTGTGATAAGTDAASATCREYPGLSYPGQGASPIHWATPTFDSSGT